LGSSGSRYTDPACSSLSMAIVLWSETSHAV
jgi:hypothetical protein